MILCESFAKKSGSQRAAGMATKSLTVGENYYSRKTEAFQSIVGYTTFSEYLIVAEVRHQSKRLAPLSSLIALTVGRQLEESKGTLKLQVSLDGVHFAEGQFPPGLGIENKAVRPPSPSQSATALADLYSASCRSTPCSRAAPTRSSST